MNYHACLFTWYLCAQRSEYERTKCWIHGWTSGFQVTLSSLINEINPSSLQNNKSGKSEVKEMGLRELRFEKWPRVPCVQFGLLSSITNFLLARVSLKVWQYVTRLAACLYVPALFLSLYCWMLPKNLHVTLLFSNRVGRKLACISELLLF